VAAGVGALAIGDSPPGRRAATGAATTTTLPPPSSTLPAPGTSTATSTPPTSHPGAVTPVSPLTVAPATTPPVTARRPALPASLIASMIDPTVVDVDARLAYQHASAAGTGIVLTANGMILTNNHVIDGGTTLGAVTVANGRAYSAQVVGVDPTADIAVLQLQGAAGLTPATTSSAPVNPGDPVVAIGNAGGLGGVPSVTTGTVIATDQSIVASDPAAGTSEQLDGLIETDANLQPGDSGGPLSNGSGQVIALDTAASVSPGSANVSFAIPIGQALAVARQIMAGQAGNGVYLGLPPFLGTQVTAGSLGGSTGAVVAAILPGGPAGGVGVTVGSLITAINGQGIDSPMTLSRVLRQYHPGESVTLSWVDRNGAPHTVRVVLGTGPAD
jgi:S1-C subfamily serine protease